jgi:hypothetical protein
MRFVNNFIVEHWFSSDLNKNEMAKEWPKTVRKWIFYKYY